MKSGVALTNPAECRRHRTARRHQVGSDHPDMLIFVSRRRGGSGRRTEDTMQNLLRQKIVPGYTVRGFRSSFMDWVVKVHAQRLLEAERALDHQIGNQVQRAYLRTDFWSSGGSWLSLGGGHLSREPSGGPVQRTNCHTPIRTSANES